MRLAGGRKWRNVSRALTFTEAHVKRAVAAAQKAGLRVASVTIKPDGTRGSA